MSGHIFPPGHFNTAENLGLAEFIYPNEEIIGELAETLPKLRNNNGVLGFSLDELASYHLIHYGADRLSTKIVAQTIAEDGINAEWLIGLPGSVENRVKELQKILANALEAGGLHGGSMALGRIALGHSPDVDFPPELTEFIEPVYITNTDIETQRTGRFLYPKEGVAMSYIGSMLESHPSAQNYDQERPDLYFDEVYIRTKEKSEFFVVVSSLKNIKDIIPFE